MKDSGWPEAVGFIAVCVMTAVIARGWPDLGERGWEALSAVATSAAVIVALLIARTEAVRGKSDASEKAALVASQTQLPLTMFMNRVELAKSFIFSQRVCTASFETFEAEIQRLTYALERIGRPDVAALVTLPDGCAHKLAIAISQADGGLEAMRGCALHLFHGLEEPWEIPWSQCFLCLSGSVSLAEAALKTLQEASNKAMTAPMRKGTS